MTISGFVSFERTRRIISLRFAVENTSTVPKLTAVPSRPKFGLGPSPPAVYALCLKIAEVFRPALRDGLPASPSEGYGCGILFGFHGGRILRAPVDSQAASNTDLGHRQRGG